MNELIPVSFQPGHDTEKVFQTLDQWDKGRKLQFTGFEDLENVEVHFSYNPTHGKAVIVKTEIVDDSIVAPIPQYFLENEKAKGTAYSIYAFVYYDKGQFADTLKRAELIVRTRPKPDDYVYTPEELKTYEELEKIVLDVQKNSINLTNVEDIVKQVLEENPTSLPVVYEEDNGKVLMVVDGAWKVNNLPLYDGTYEVTPSADNVQTLKTSQKFMNGDVVVSKIPYFDVSNESGGTTVYIGEEIEYGYK